MTSYYRNASNPSIHISYTHADTRTGRVYTCVVYWNVEWKSVAMTPCRTYVVTTDDCLQGDIGL